LETKIVLQGNAIFEGLKFDKEKTCCRSWYNMSSLHCWIGL